MKNSLIDSKNAGLRNENLVLSLLRKHGPLSQAQICKRANLGSSTASCIVGRLREKNLITEQPGKSNKPGAKPVVISINPQGQFIVGVEINPSNIFIGLFDFNCQLIEEIKVSLDSDHSVENVIHLLEINLKGLISKHNVVQAKLIGVGITLSGSISPKGIVELSSPLGWKSVPLKKMLSARFSCPVQIHITRVRLLAEMSIEPGLSSKNVLYLNVANGVGGTIIIDGKLIHGATNRCGEIGHTIVDPDGPLCGCGHKGCLEAFISGPALAKKIKDDIAAGVKTILADSVADDDIPEEVVGKWGQAIKEKDSYALSMRDFVADFLSRSAAIAINCYDPDMVILAGYVTTQCVDYLAEAIRKRIPTDVYDDSSRSFEIAPARAGEEALIRGVATAVLQSSLETT